MGTSRNGSKPLSVAALAVIVGLVRSGFAAPPPSSDAAPSPPGSPGSEPDSVRSFSALRAQGNAAYKAGRVAEAVEAWTRAYAIRPSHAVACAIGRIEFLARGNALEGARWLTRCVNQAPLPDPSQPKEFTSQKEELELRDLARARVGAVRVVTDAGAMIEVDGREVGKGPLDDEVFLMPGAHRFRVLLGERGERSRLIEVTLAAGESRTVDLSLPATSPPAPSRPPLLSQAVPSGGAQEGLVKPSNEVLLGAGMVVGGIGLAVTIGFGVAAGNARSEEKRAADALKTAYGYLPCLTPGHPECAYLKATSDEADAFTVISLLGLSTAAAGGVMTACAIFNPPRKASASGAQVTLRLAPGGLVLRGRF